MTIQDFVERVAAWGSCWVECVRWYPGAPSDYYDVRVMWMPDLGEYASLYIGAETADELWLQFIAKAPL